MDDVTLPNGRLVKSETEQVNNDCEIIENVENDQTIETNSLNSESFVHSESSEDSLNAINDDLPPGQSSLSMGDFIEFTSCDSLSASEDTSGEGCSSSSTSLYKENATAIIDANNTSTESIQKEEQSFPLKSQDDADVLEPETTSSEMGVQTLRNSSSIHLDKHLSGVSDQTLCLLPQIVPHYFDDSNIFSDMKPEECNDKQIEAVKIDDKCSFIDDEHYQPCDDESCNIPDYELPGLNKAKLLDHSINDNSSSLPEQYLLLQTRECPHLIDKDPADVIPGNVCTEVCCSCLEESNLLGGMNHDYSLYKEENDNCRTEKSVLTETGVRLPFFPHCTNQGTEEQPDKPPQEFTLKDHFSRISNEIHKAEEMRHIVIQKLNTSFQDIAHGITRMTQDLADTICDIEDEGKDESLVFNETLPQETNIMFDQLFSSISEEVQQLQRLVDQLNNNLDPNHLNDFN